MDENEIKSAAENAVIILDGRPTLVLRDPNNTLEGVDAFVVPMSSELAYAIGVRLIERALEAKGREWKVTGLVFDVGEGVDFPEGTPEKMPEGN